jgi:hypothetical protein
MPVVPAGRLDEQSRQFRAQVGGEAAGRQLAANARLLRRLPRDARGVDVPASLLTLAEERQAQAAAARQAITAAAGSKEERSSLAEELSRVEGLTQTRLGRECNDTFLDCGWIHMAEVEAAAMADADLADCVHEIPVCGTRREVGCCPARCLARVERALDNGAVAARAIEAAIFRDSCWRDAAER